MKVGEKMIRRKAGERVGNSYTGIIIFVSAV